MEKRIHFLSSIFNVDLVGYAVMSNHYHLILRLSPDLADSWSDEEVIHRWLRLFPKTNSRSTNGGVSDLIKDSSKVTELRRRLSSLSWFMRCLNEPLARWANKEDECTGRFWEGRFKSQQILDEASLLACMAYVDLNPVRAGLTRTPKEASYTSLNFRLKNQKPNSYLKPLNNPQNDLGIRFRLSDYIELVNWTAQRNSHRSKQISPRVELALHKHLAIDKDTLQERVMPKPGYWQRALGSLEHLQNYARQIGQLRIRRYSPSY